MADSKNRMVILAADHQAIQHMMGKAGASLLPWRRDEKLTVTPSDIERLPQTARVAAVADGPWTPLRATMAWSEVVGLIRLAVWTVEPSPAEPSSHGINLE
jgi:hypothetical protein